MTVNIQSNVKLAPYTSWRVGGTADWFALPASTEELQEILIWAESKHLPVTILGGGSNVLIADEGIRGLVICTRNLDTIELEHIESGEFRLIAMAGTLKVKVMKSFLREGLAPALFLAGLPGDLGGGIVMNAGVNESRQPREFCEIVDWFEVATMDGREVRRFSKDDITWSYRHTQGWQPGVIVRVALRWPHRPEEGIQRQVREAHRLRQSKQPLQEPSCGSTFKNPPGSSAGKLIDECGLKGFTIGGAQVSKKHANFIINRGHATADDIKVVIRHVQQTVLNKTGILLQCEVVPLGLSLDLLKPQSDRSKDC